MAAEVDVRAISAFSSIPESSINSLLSSPTTELVASLLKGIENKVKEFEQTKSQKVKLEVELETVVRTSESKVKVLQNSRDKALVETSKLRVELQTAENARSRAQSELEQARAATTSETTELSTLRSRVSSLEATNRDTLALLESKNTAYESLAQDLSAAHQKAADLRKQIATLEQSVQTTNSSMASAKFREQSLQQEVELLKKNNEWLENERKIKADEHTNFRKEKNARISELSRSNEQNISEVEALRRTETSLKQRLEEQIAKFEEGLEEMQKLREEKIAAEDSFRVELESVNRLAELQAASAETARQRVQELSTALQEAQDEAADEIGAIRAENETEHNDRLAAEERIAELERSLEQLSTELEEARQRSSTPQRATNGSAAATPARPSTPSGIFSPGIVSRGKSQMTVTQLFAEYKKLESDLISERRGREQLQENLDAMVEELENSKPEIEELREDHARLQGEVVQMSQIMDKANAERDAAVKELRACQGQLQSKSTEVEVLAQQLRDKGSEIRYLLIEQYVREQGQELSREEFEELDRRAQTAAENDMASLSENQQLINQRLIVFKNITELTQQNENQLKTIRNLIHELEVNEAKEREQLQQNLSQELEQARAQIKSYQEELNSMVNQTKTFIKERDMFRSMLTRRGGHLPSQIQPNDFSRSMPIPHGESPAPPASNGDTELAGLLRTIQQDFDSYRQESSTNQTFLKKQVDEFSKKNSQLQTELSRATGQLTSANQRYEMLQANYHSLKTENGEIQKRSWTAMENATKQEVKTQQLAEELVEARNLLDGLRRDSANLKAEKDLWKSVERRLIEDNESLRNERSRLDQLNASLQTMINEREQTDSETRRRLQSQVESLEGELQTAKRKLNDEIEEAKKASLRREYEHNQSQTRIDDLVTSLSSTKEELASAKTSRDHLQARVDELAVELRSAEERIEVLTKPAEPEAEVNGEEPNSITKEQELAVEVSELKRDLELRTSELDRANEQVEVYKNIAQSTEERLQELGETNDQYREETDATLAEKDSKIKDLEQRVEDISTELNSTSQELSALRNDQADFDRKLAEQKASLESDMTRLKEEAERSAEQAQFNLEASKIQAQIATEAQQNYENELVKHAEAAKNLHTVRDEANQVKLELVDLRAQAETAKADLESKQASWDEMKDRYEREVGDLKKRREDVMHQNNLLHSQLEGVTQQITALQRDRASLTESSASESTTQPTNELDKLQEVITYIRREKDIVDVQYQLSTQEGKRLRQQLDFTQSQLDETRLKLDQQRRAEADSERNAISHAKLMENINELNLYRESSVTLRAEAKQAKQALAEKTHRVEQLESEMQTLQARVSELENLLELKEGELKLSQEDRDHWQQRTQNILSKYDRVDPAELEALKEKITALEGERDQLRTELEQAATEREEAIQEQIEATQAAVATAKSEQKATLETQFKGVIRDKNTALKDRKAEYDGVVAERDALQNELETVKEELATAQAQGPTTSPAQVNGDHQPEAGTTDDNSAEFQSKIEALEKQLAAKDKEIEEMTSTQEEKFKARVQANEGVLNKRLAAFKQEAQQAQEKALDDLRTRLDERHQQELEELRAQSIPVASELQKPVEGAPVDTPAESDVIPSDEALTSLPAEKAKWLAKNHSAIRGMVAHTIKNKLETEIAKVRAEYATSQKSTSDGSVPAPDEEAEARLEAQKEAIIKEKQAEFDAEKEQLNKQHEEALNQERQTLLAKYQEELRTRKLEFDEEAAKKIAEQVKNAELMATKGNNLKLNMAQNRLNAANAKIEVVSKAAEETPEKPVKEVWEVAKTAKPAPAAKPAAPAATSVAAPKPPTPTTTAPPSKTEAAKPEALANGEVSEEKPPAPATAPQQPKPNSLQSSASEAPKAPNKMQSGIPLPGGRRASGLPVARGGGQQNVRGNHRGGRGGNRGDNQTSGGPGRGGAAGAVNSPRSGGSGAAGGGGSLNPNAAQFTPGGGGQKRSFEGDEGGVGKRIKGAEEQ
jgi:nucleoprotein TPR